eukprot:509213-Pleurochrysis_carterae.AAC.1
MDLVEASPKGVGRREDSVALASKMRALSSSHARNFVCRMLHDSVGRRDCYPAQGTACGGT